MRYLDEAKELWAKYVPQEGQADTQQGELLRAVEKLRHETMNNGNINWDDGHATSSSTCAPRSHRTTASQPTTSARSKRT